MLCYGTFHFLSASPNPPKDGRNPNPQILLSAIFEKLNLKGLNFVGFFKEKIRTLLGKNSPSLAEKMECPYDEEVIYLKIL